MIEFTITLLLIMSLLFNVRQVWPHIRREYRRRTRPFTLVSIQRELTQRILQNRPVVKIVSDLDSRDLLIQQYVEAQYSFTTGTDADGKSYVSFNSVPWYVENLPPNTIRFLP